MAGASSDTERGQIPRLRSGIDLTKVGLSMEEGFVASRVDGRTSIAEIAILVGKPKKETEQILERLLKVGVIQLGGSGDEPERAPRVRKGDGESEYGDFVFPAALMHESCDLSSDERKRIIFFHSHLEIWSFYEILQVRRLDDEKAIKTAYYERSKEWHPDRFRRANLGSFKRMIDEIYKHIKEGYGVLSDPKQRERYNEKVVFMPEEDEIAEMLDHQRRHEREKKREGERLDRRKRRNPIVKRLNQAKEIFAQAEEKEKGGDMVGALRMAQTAFAYDPRPEFGEAVERLKLATGESRVGPLLRRGAAHESMLNWSEAIQDFSEAVRFAPDHGQARLRLAYNLIMGGREAQEANVHAHKAVELLPDDPEAHFVLGMCYEKGGLEKAAVRAYSRVLELKSNHSEAKKRLKRLKWGF